MGDLLGMNTLIANIVVFLNMDTFLVSSQRAIIEKATIYFTQLGTRILEILF